MRKQRSEQSFPNWVFLGVILLIVIVLYFIFRTEKIKQYKDDLKERINEKERDIANLTKELNKLKALRGDLTQLAIRFFKIVKVTLLVFLIGIGIIGYALFNLSVLEAIAVIGTVTTVFMLIYNAYTIIIQNKLGNLNTTLEILQEYFISKSFEINGFEPLLINAYESKLDKEVNELKELKKKHNYFLSADTKIKQLSNFQK